MRDITPQMAAAELARRQGASPKSYSGITQADAQQELLRRNGYDSQQSLSLPQMGSELLNSAGRMIGDVPAGLANVGNNLNHYIVNSLQTLMPNSKTLSNINSALPERNADFSSAFGVQNPSIVDKFIQSGVGYAPFAAGGEGLIAAKGLQAATPLLTRLGSQAISGSLFGATQSDNPVTGSMVGAVTAPLAELGIRGASKVPSLLMNKLSQFAAPGLAKSAINDLSTSLDNEQAFNLAKNNYNQFEEKENSAWDQVKNQAALADKNGAQFDNSNYKDSIVNKWANLSSESEKQTGLQRKNKDALSLLEDYIQDEHGTFTDAIQHNKSLNADFKNEIAPGQPLPFQTVNFAKSNLQKAIQDNLEKNGLQDTLGQAWNSANDLTTQKNQIFSKVTSPSGKDSWSSFSTYLNGKSPFADRGNFVNDYLPSGSQDSLGKMQQLGKMLGDENKSKEIIKKNYFDTDKGVTAPSFIKNYNSLSPQERQYLFNDDQNKAISALKTVLENNPDALKQSSWTSLWHHSIPFLMGGFAGHEMGAPLMESGIAAVLASNLAKSGLKKTFSNPAMQNFWTNYLSQQQSDQMSPLAQALSRSAQAVIAPQTAGSTMNKYRSVPQWPY